MSGSAYYGVNLDYYKLFQTYSMTKFNVKINVLDFLSDRVNGYNSKYVETQKACKSFIRAVQCINDSKNRYFIITYNLKYITCKTFYKSKRLMAAINFKE